MVSGPREDVGGQPLIVCCDDPRTKDGGASSSSASSESYQGPPAEASADSSVWYDCSEEWCDDQPGSSPAAAPAAAGGLTQATLQQLAAVPDAKLRHILHKYIQGDFGALGCKPAVALLLWMQDTHTDLSQLQRMLAPLLEGSSEAGPLMPTPTARQTSAEITHALRCQQRGASATSAAAAAPAHADGSGIRGTPQQLVSHLLGNVRLALEALEAMDEQEGWRQVAWGPLALWYSHDTVRRRQTIRATCVLEEPVSTIAALTREVDLTPSWNPCMCNMCELASYSPTELLVYVLLWMPWPLYLPEVINYAVGLDLLDLKRQPCVLVATESVPPPAGVDVPNHPRKIQMIMHAGGFRLVPLPPDPQQPHRARTEVTVLVSVDAARFTVPDSVISVILKVVAPLIFKSVLRVLKRLFHQQASGAAAATAAAAAVQGGVGSAAAVPPAAAGGGDSFVASGALLERRGLRPEYAALDARAVHYLATRPAPGDGALAAAVAAL